MKRVRAEETVPVAIGLGSNLGDRARHIEVGLKDLEEILEELRASQIHETTPMYMVDQPLFLNACCTGRTEMSARELLETLWLIERRVGRTPGGPRNGPRMLDLDLLLYGARIIEEPGLTVPHPLMEERMFVLGPLAEVAGAWRHPVTGLTVERMKNRLERQNVSGRDSAPVADA